MLSHANFSTFKGSGIAAMAIMKPELIMKAIIPVVMAGETSTELSLNNATNSHNHLPLLGIIAIYGLVVAILIAGKLEPSPKYSLYDGFIHLGAGLAVGFSGLAAGFAIGIVGDCGVRGVAQQPRLFVGMILILIFAEVLGLYGLIVAVYLYAK